MNKGLWIARKNYLFGLMKKVSDGHGGDTPDDFQKIFHETLESHPDEKIEEAIRCYEEMVEQLKYYLQKEK